MTDTELFKRLAKEMAALDGQGQQQEQPPTKSLADIKGESWDDWHQRSLSEPEPIHVGITMPTASIEPIKKSTVDSSGEPTQEKQDESRLGKRLLIPSSGLTGIMGCTSHGKSVMLLNLARYLLSAKKTTAYYSYEESKSQIIYKLALAIGCGANEPLNADPMRSIREYHRTGDWNHRYAKSIDITGYNDVALQIEVYKKQFQAGLDAVRGYMDSGKLILVTSDNREPDSLELADEIRVLRKETDIAAVLIDYIQLINADSNGRSTNRQYEMKEICQDLRRVANETGLPIILAGQFNRTAVKSHRSLTLDKIGEAGDIERAMSCVIALWNHDKATQSDKGERIDPPAETKGHISLVVLKNRDGETQEQPFLLKTNLANRHIDLASTGWLKDATSKDATTSKKEKKQVKHEIGKAV